MHPPAERLVGGMTCSDVLAVLSDFLDGGLDAKRHKHVVVNLRGCTWCETFGGRFREVIETLRRELKQPEPLAGEIVARLRERLERE